MQGGDSARRRGFMFQISEQMHAVRAGAPPPLVLRWLEQEDRDLARRARLVLGAGRISGYRTFPPRGAFGARRLPGDHVGTFWSGLQLALAIGLQVVVPDRVLRCAAHRGNRDVTPVVLDP